MNSLIHGRTLFGFILLGLACSSRPVSARSPTPEATLRLASPVVTGIQPHLHLHPNAATAPVGYVPAQVRHAYGIDLLPNGGQGQTIAIVDAYGSPTAQKDLNTFCTQFGLPVTTLQMVYGSTPPTTTDAGWALETALDLQWAHAVAPKAKLILAVANSASLTSLLQTVDAAVRAGANVVSMSWGAGEFAGESAYDSHFPNASVTFLASSGDQGAGASWPSISPQVVSVGGSTLHLDAKGNATAPETGWSGSGGGFSRYVARPSYQNGWQTNVHRASPDVCMLADPATGVAVYTSTPYGGKSGWFAVGGTSLSSPLWAGLVALANEQLAISGVKPKTSALTGVYTLANKTDAKGGSQYSYFFFDIKAGSNGGYSATAKYDEVTGLGSPIAPNVALYLDR